MTRNQEAMDARQEVLLHGYFAQTEWLCHGDWPDQLPSNGVSLRRTPSPAPPILFQVLALELLKIVLENAGPAVHRNERFIAAIRQYLCASLLKNHGSNIPQVMWASCQVLQDMLF